ncbi:MAG TPA: DUF3035 domain-containing protein [Stellaceae bacterium]|nr:DUF3035 domain-containing protein [Stellaceae bacterium]
MLQYRPVRGAGRTQIVLGIACLAAVALLSGCSDVKQMLGIDPTMPDEFAVESRAPLTIPPDFNLRPPEPGAPRPQEESSEQQAEQIIDQAGPGAPGKQESDLRLRSAENGLPNIGGNSQTPDPSGMVGSQSLSNRLLDYGDTGNAGATVDKRDTTPLKGVY